LKVKSRRQDKN